MEQYREFVMSLQLEQMVALYNIIGYFALISTLFSICLIFVGDSLIKRFQIDGKNPKLAIIVKYITRVNKVSLKFYVFMLFLIILINIGVNAYMFIIAF